MAAAPQPTGPATPVEDQAPAAGTVHDNKILKFTQDGKFLMQIGKPGQSKGSNDPENLKGRRPKCSSIRRPMSCMSPTATATTA